MAQVVDTKGKTKAAPSGKVMNGGKKKGNSLREDLTRSTGINTGTPEGYENTLANALDKATRQKTTHSVSKPRVSSSGSNRNSLSDSAPSYGKMTDAQSSLATPKSSAASMRRKSPSSGTGMSYAGISGGTPVSYGQSSGLSFSSPSTVTSMRQSSPSVTSDDFFGESRNRSQDEINSVYEKDMLDNGVSQDYIDKFMKGPEYSYTPKDIWDDTINALKDPQAASEDLLDAVDSNSMLDPEAVGKGTEVDDGTMDSPHLLSDWMTGKQYYHYVHDLGMPGMPEDQIDISNGKYSKAQQRQLYGFPYYIPSDTYELGMSLPNLEAAIYNIDNYVKNLRQRGFHGESDYQIETDTGKGNGIENFSGNDFDMVKNGYLSQVNDLYERASKGDPDAMSVFLDSESESPYTPMVKEHELPDGSKHYGVVTERRPVNDLQNKDVMEDLLNWNIDDDTEWTYPDENGMSTFGNITVKLDDNYNIVSGTWQTKDGYNLDIEVEPDGSFRPVFEGKEYDKWVNSHDTGDEYIAFSDGTSATVSGEDIDKAMKKSPNKHWYTNEFVNYNDTNLKDIDGFDLGSLTVGKPTSLEDAYNWGKGKGSEAGVIYVPDMVLPDGTAISKDVALKLARDENPDDWEKDKIRYHFEPRGGFNLKKNPWLAPIVGSNPLLWLTDSRPRRLMHDEIIDEDGLHLGINETPDWIADAALNSILISTPIYQWLDSAANAVPYFRGIETGSGDKYGRYQSTGYEPGSEENMAKATSTFLGPALENLSGLGHEPVLDPIVGKLIDRKFADDTFTNLALNKTWDAIGEGLEEIIGNYFDEPGTYGFKNAWANPISRPYAGMGKIYDKDHKQIGEVGDDVSDEDLSKLYDEIVKKYGQDSQFPVLYDEHGREFKDPNTPIGDRFINAFEPTPEHWRETANAAFGGAGVSLLYNFPELLYGAGTSLLRRPKVKNDTILEDWETDADNEDADSDIYVPESVRGGKSDRISSNDYTINPGAPIRFKE